MYCYLFCNFSCETAEEAMKFFGEMRTHNGKVVILFLLGICSHLLYPYKYSYKPGLGQHTSCLWFIVKFGLHPINTYN